MADPIDLTLNDFKEKIGLGTRPNRYTVSLEIPGSSFTLTAEVSAASIPGSELPAIRVPFRGRILKMPGDRIYSPWTFTVYDTTKAPIWQHLHDWSDNINTHDKNITDWDPDESASVANWTIKHHDLNGESTPIKQINLVNCWPTLVGPIELAAGVMDTLTTFTCTVEYEYYTLGDESPPTDGR